MALFVLLPPVSVVGTWVPDALKRPLRFDEKGMRFTLGKDGTMSFRGFNVSGAGTYRVQGSRVFFTLARRGATKPTNSRESRGEARIAEGGKVLLIPSGGSGEATRLVRARG